MSRRHLLVPLPLLLASALVVLPGQPGSAAGPTCDGKSATIVAGPADGVVGTEGDDVIVATDVIRISALGGDDTICSTLDHTQHTDHAVIDAGAGADTVHVDAPNRVVQALLGAGDDTYVGNGPAFIVARGAGADRDDVTSTAPDTVVYSGKRGDANQDVVHARRLYLVLYSVGGTYTATRGGTLSVKADGGPDQSWRLDMAAGTLSDGTATASILGLTNVDLNRVIAFKDLAVRGTMGHDFVDVGRDSQVQHDYDRGPIDVRLAGGADTLSLGGDLKGSITGGTGRDQLSLSGLNLGGPTPMSADLRPGGSVEVDGRTTLALRGFENLDVSTFRSATITGSAAANLIYVGACRATVRSLGGVDNVDPFIAGSRCAGVPYHLRVELGAGNDTAYGREGDDVLFGGPGRDTVDGLTGRDRCVAETERHCER